MSFLTPTEINTYFPISGITIVPNGVILTRACRLLPGDPRVRGDRRKITKSHRRSLNKLVFKVLTCGIQFLSLITLTYGPSWPLNGQQVKSDLNEFLIYMKRSFGSFDYFWYLEFQTRRAPHFHIGTTLRKPTQCHRELMATIWSNIIEPQNLPYTAIVSPYGRKNAAFGMWTKDSVFKQHRRWQNWQGIEKDDGAIRYVVKYATKAYQKQVPPEYRDVGRFWSTSRNVAVPKGIDVPVREDEVREVLKKFGRDFDSWEVLPKYIFLNTPKS